MDQRLSFVTLATPDLDATRAFYATGLGWQPLIDVPGEVIFFQAAPGLVLGFFEATSFNRDMGLDGAASLSGVTLAHNVDSEDAVRATVAVMEAAGGTVSTPPQPGDFGGIFHAHVTDPNGVIWEVAHNPGWSVAEDGTVRFG